jgi:Calcineurin-like phosphoesterase
LTMIVTYRCFEKALAEVFSQPLSVPSGPESIDDRLTDAEVRAYLTEALDHLRSAPSRPGVLIAPDEQLASLLQSRLAEHCEEISVIAEPAPAGGLEVKYDKGDIHGWFRSVFTWWRQIKPEPWRTAPDAAERVGGSRLRAALLADWGTGLYGAPVSARSIKKDPVGYDLLVHLGDVYYSGTEKEVQENFLDCWPDVPGAVSRAVNSNHEMYSGGVGLFRRTLPAFGQQATYFALQTDHWLLVGLDTAYSQHDLAGKQVEWLGRVLAAAGNRKLILFSHHQPFSLLDRQGPKLVAKLGEFLDRRQVFAWYWGHEHRCIVYDRHPVWHLLGRCVGNGGFPAFRDQMAQFPSENGDERWRRLPPCALVPGGIMLDAPNMYVSGHEQEYGAHGYVSLEFEGPHLAETIHLANGTKVLEREVA